MVAASVALPSEEHELPVGAEARLLGHVGPPKLPSGEAIDHPRGSPGHDDQLAVGADTRAGGRRALERDARALSAALDIVEDELLRPDARDERPRSIGPPFERELAL